MRQMTLVAFLQAHNCSNFVGSWRHPEALPDFTFLEGDLSAWSAPRAADVLYSNAALQWLGDHDRLFPRLMAQLAPGGVMVLPLGPHSGTQQLVKVTKGEQVINQEDLIGVRFVPLLPGQAREL